MKSPYLTLSGVLPVRNESRDASSRSHRDRFGFLLALFLSAVLALMRLVDVSEDGKAVIAFGVVFSTIAFYVAILRPRWFPLFLVAYLPYCMVFPFTLPGLVGFNMMNLLVACGAVAWASNHLQGRKAPRGGIFELLVLIYILLGFASAVQAYVASPGIVDIALLFRGWVTPLLLFFICRGLVRDRRDISNVLTLVAYTTVFVAVTTWAEGIERGGRGSIEHSRVGGVLKQPNEMGAFLVYYGIPLLALAVMARRSKQRVLYLGGYLVVARSILFTFSRGAYISFAAGSALVLLLRSPVYLVGVAAGGTATLVVFPSLMPESVAKRIQETTSEDEIAFGQVASEMELDRSSRLRFVLWRAAEGMILERPLQGFGLGRFPSTVDKYTEIVLRPDDPHDAHNAYLLVAAEMGLPALAVFVVLLAMAMVTALKIYFRPGSPPSDRTMALAFIGSEIGVMTSCMLGSRFSDEALVGEFWILIALVLVLNRLRPKGVRGRAWQ
jgi:O-antigen ligase